MSLKPFSACVVPERTASVAADAVRGRIDWKYLLCLELDDPGFDHSVLCEFRARLLEGGAERILFDKTRNNNAVEPRSGELLSLSASIKTCTAPLAAGSIFANADAS